MYRCSKCQMAVIVIQEKVIKACKCEASISADMTAKVSGYGGLQQR